MKFKPAIIINQRGYNSLSEKLMESSNDPLALEKVLELWYQNGYLKDQNEVASEVCLLEKGNINPFLMQEVWYLTKFFWLVKPFDIKQAEN